MLKLFAISLAASLALQPSPLIAQQTGTPNANAPVPKGTASGPQTLEAPEADARTEGKLTPTFEISTASLVLSQGKPVSGVGGSFTVMLPVQCTADGRILAQIPEPPEFRTFRVVSLSPSGGREFNFKTIPDLYDLQLFSIYASDSDVILLFYAAEDSKISDYTMTTDTGKVITGKGNQTEHHTYAVRFGPDGKYKSTTKMPDGQIAHKVASLGSDQLLVLSYDQANRVPVLRVLDSGGRPVSLVQLPAGLTDYAEVKQGETGDSMSAGKAETSVAGWQFIPARGRVLLYRPHSTSPVLEIGAGGYRREVPIAAPPGYEIDDFIPSTKQWYVRFRRSGAGDSGGPVSRNDFQLAELNPGDGSIARLFKIDPDSLFDVACEADGEFVSYTLDKDHFMLSSTDVPH